MVSEHCPAPLLHGLRGLFVIFVATWASGCASNQRQPDSQSIADASDVGTALVPANDAERQLLSRLDGLASDTPTKLGGLTVIAEPTYSAASGRPCRPLSLQGPGQKVDRRLACKGEDGWVYVPNVLVAAPTGASRHN